MNPSQAFETEHSDGGADTLNELEAKIDPEKMKMPSFKMVLTAIGDYSYRRPKDSVWVYEKQGKWRVGGRNVLNLLAYNQKM